MKNEIWKNIPFNENYQVSSFGNVRRGNIEKAKIKHNSGYHSISIMGKKYLLHRIVALTFIRESSLEVDHINGNKIDNSINNLRYVNRRENCTYFAKTRNKSSKYTGVSWSNSAYKWKTGITIDKKHYHFGHFNDEEYASNIYSNALNCYKAISLT